MATRHMQVSAFVVIQRGGLCGFIPRTANGAKPNYRMARVQVCTAGPNLKHAENKAAPHLISSTPAIS